MEHLILFGYGVLVVLFVAFIVYLVYKFPKFESLIDSLFTIGFYLSLNVVGLSFIYMLGRGLHFFIRVFTV